MNDDWQPMTTCFSPGTGEDEACGDAEEHPPFPLYLLHMNASEHVRYLGFTGGNCLCGAENCK